MSDSPETSAKSSVSYENRRAVPRYTLIATVEIVDPSSGIRLSGRISEISLKGCYVDLLNTLPKGTAVQMRVSRDVGIFESPAKIAYAQDGMGIGLAFTDTPADQLKILENWVAELGS